MRVHIVAVGRLRAGPERDLIDDYTTRFDRTGRSLGLGPLTIHEVEDKKGGGMSAEAALLSRAVPEGAVIVAMDERGKVQTRPNSPSNLRAGAIKAAVTWRSSSAAQTGSTRPCAVRRMRRCRSARWSGRTCWPAPC